MDIDVNALHQGYLRGARHRGAELLTDAGVTALTYGDSHWRVTTAAGSLSAPVVVNAAGAWCDVIGAMAGARPIGLVPKRRTAITFDAPALDGAMQWPLTIDVDEELYFKPEAGGLLASPADETPSPPCDAQPEELDIALAVDRLERATSLEVAGIPQPECVEFRSLLPLIEGTREKQYDYIYGAYEPGSQRALIR